MPQWVPATNLSQKRFQRGENDTGQNEMLKPDAAMVGQKRHTHDSQKRFPDQPQ